MKWLLHDSTKCLATYSGQEKKSVSHSGEKKLHHSTFIKILIALFIEQKPEVTIHYNLTKIRQLLENKNSLTFKINNLERDTFAKIYLEPTQEI